MNELTHSEKRCLGEEWIVYCGDEKTLREAAREFKRWDTILRLFRNPYLPPDLIMPLLDKGLSVTGSLDGQIAYELAHAGVFHRNVRIEDLVALSAHIHRVVRAQVARHEQTPPEVLLRLGLEQVSIASRVVHNPACSVETLAEIYAYWGRTSTMTRGAVHAMVHLTLEHRSRDTVRKFTQLTLNA